MEQVGDTALYNYIISNANNSNNKLSSAWHAARMSMHTVFLTLSPTSRDWLAGFSGSQ